MAVDLLLDIYDVVTVVPFLLGYLPFNVNHIACVMIRMLTMSLLVYGFEHHSGQRSN